MNKCVGETLNWPNWYWTFENRGVQMTANNTQNFPLFSLYGVSKSAIESYYQILDFQLWYISYYSIKDLNGRELKRLESFFQFSFYLLIWLLPPMHSSRTNITLLWLEYSCQIELIKLTVVEKITCHNLFFCIFSKCACNQWDIRWWDIWKTPILSYSIYHDGVKTNF